MQLKIAIEIAFMKIIPYLFSKCKIYHTKIVSLGSLFSAFYHQQRYTSIIIYYFI
ncbi:hypothetical protein Nizo2264_0628 [Lactiplantibacillus plantarum]|nr:hypothetical protein Nizo2264_0628 [Lactiplantibacillus plantarum]